MSEHAFGTGTKKVVKAWFAVLLSHLQCVNGINTYYPVLQGKQHRKAPHMMYLHLFSDSQNLNGGARQLGQPVGTSEHETCMLFERSDGHDKICR